MSKIRKQETLDTVDSDDDRPFTEVPDLAKQLPQASDKTTEILDQALAGLSSRSVLTWSPVSFSDGPSFQMEKLVRSNPFHDCDDLVLRVAHLYGATGSDGYGQFVLMLPPISH